MQIQEELIKGTENEIEVETAEDSRTEQKVAELLGIPQPRHSCLLFYSLLPPPPPSLPPFPSLPPLPPSQSTPVDHFH